MEPRNVIFYRSQKPCKPGRAELVPIQTNCVVKKKWGDTQRMGAEWLAQLVHPSTGLGGVWALDGIGKFRVVFEADSVPVTRDLGVFERRELAVPLDDVLIVHAQRAVPVA